MIAEQKLQGLIAGTPQFKTLTNYGDRIEEHQIWCLSIAAEEILFAEARQIFAIRRIVTPKSSTAKASDEISYGITSLPVTGTKYENAETVLTIRRKHWSIESKSHNCRDKTYQEDSCQVRDHKAARSLVTFRQLAIFLTAIDAHHPRTKRDCCVPEFNRYCSFNRNDVRKWFMNKQPF